MSNPAPVIPANQRAGSIGARRTESDGLNLPARFDVAAYLDKAFADASAEFDRVMRFGTEGTPGTPRPVNPINDYDIYRRL